MWLPSCAPLAQKDLLRKTFVHEHNKSPILEPACKHKYVVHGCLEYIFVSAQQKKTFLSLGSSLSPLLSSHDFISAAGSLGGSGERI